MNLAVTTCVVAVGSTMYAGYLKGQHKGSKPYAFTFQPILGGFVLAVFLIAITSASPVLGRDFAYLILISAALVNGGTIFNSLNSKGL